MDRQKLYADKAAFEVHFASIGKTITKEWDNHSHCYAFAATHNLFLGFLEGRKYPSLVEVGEVNALNCNTHTKWSAKIPDGLHKIYIKDQP